MKGRLEPESYTQSVRNKKRSFQFFLSSLLISFPLSPLFSVWIGLNQKNHVDPPSNNQKLLPRCSIDSALNDKGRELPPTPDWFLTIILFHTLLSPLFSVSSPLLLLQKRFSLFLSVSRFQASFSLSPLFCSSHYFIHHLSFRRRLPLSNNPTHSTHHHQVNPYASLSILSPYLM